MPNNVIKKRITFILEHYGGYYNQFAGMLFWQLISWYCCTAKRALCFTHPKLMLYSGRPKKPAAGPYVSEAADKNLPWEYEWAGGYDSFLNVPTIKRLIYCGRMRLPTSRWQCVVVWAFVIALLPVAAPPHFVLEPLPHFKPLCEAQCSTESYWA